MQHARLMFLAILVVGMAVLGSNLWAPEAPVQAAGGATVTIPGDAYTPAAVMIEVGQTVTWINKDSDPHVTTNVPGTPEVFTLVHPSGKAASFKFAKPGIYPYYCLDHATFNTKLRRVVARKEADGFPIAMEGLIVVKGSGFTGAPSATVNVSAGTYAPDNAVVEAGGKVTWTNGDTAAHTVVFTGTETPKLDLPVGKSQTVTFKKPGIYLYYDERYATYNSKMGLAAAKKGAPDFPVSMQGYVIVL